MDAGRVDPAAALRQIAFYKDRAREDPRRVMAYRKAADVVAALDDDTRERLGRSADSPLAMVKRGEWSVSARYSWPRAAAVAAISSIGADPSDQSEWQCRSPRRTATISPPPKSSAAPRNRTRASGSRPDHACAIAAAVFGPTPGSDCQFPDRLRRQLDVIDEIRERVAPLRILSGIEVDILEDGSLDQDPELLSRLDVVVASVHSKLTMDAPAMTRRMVRAVADSRVTVLGHCTGRLVAGARGTRSESRFDAEAVFTACRDHNTAVEINSRPERRDPPTRLLRLAEEIGCAFSIDTDAHAPGQLDFLGYGAQRALDAGVPADRIINTWPADRLLAWPER